MKHSQIYSRAFGMVCTKECAECRQGAMFEVAPKPTEQEKQIKRVRSGIAEIVLKFCRLRVGHEFHASTLHAFVEAAMGGNGYVAPDSPSRILRDLAKSGAVTYEVVDRSKSLYRITTVNL